MLALFKFFGADFLDFRKRGRDQFEIAEKSGVLALESSNLSRDASRVSLRMKRAFWYANGAMDEYSDDHLHDPSSDLPDPPKRVGGTHPSIISVT